MKKWMFIVLLVFVCLIGMVRISYAEISSITIVPVHSLFVLRNIPVTSEEKPMFQLTFLGEEPDLKKADFSFQTQVLMNDSIVYTNQHRYAEQISRAKPNYKCDVVVQTDSLPPGKYIYKVIVLDNNSGKILSKETSFEIVDDQNLRILEFQLLTDNFALSQPIFFKDAKYAIFGKFSSVSEKGDNISVTVSFKEEPQTICGNIEGLNANANFLAIFAPTIAGKHILVVKAVDKTKNLEVEYELPVMVVDPREIME